MSEYLDIADTIRSVLANGSYAPEAELTSLALSYANLCREAIRRLRRCGEYLRNGRRSEAVHLAACPPNLFELYSALQFPEAAEWERVCGAFGLPSPPRLHQESLAELNDAIAREREMENLLGRHRVLALAKAPLASRLHLLRTIAERDLENRAWREELRALESVRLRELWTEAKAAVDAKDVSVLERIWSELLESRWQHEVPKELTESILKARKFLQNQETLAEMRGLLAQLLSAHEAQSYETCVALMNNWQEIVESRHPSLPPEFFVQVRPVAAWVAAEDRRRGMAQKRENLQRRLEASEEEIRKNRKRHVVIAAAVSVGISLVLAAVTYIILWHANR